MSNRSCLFGLIATLFCPLCDVNVPFEEAQEHLSGDAHKDQLKRHGITTTSLHAVCATCGGEQFPLSSEALEKHVCGNKHKKALGSAGASDATAYSALYKKSLSGLAYFSVVDSKALPNHIAVEDHRANALEGRLKLQHLTMKHPFTCCEECNATFTDAIELSEHLGSAMHVITTLPGDLVNTSLNTCHNSACVVSQEASGANHYRCVLCDVSSDSLSTLSEHLSSDYHKQSCHRLSPSGPNGCSSVCLTCSTAENQVVLKSALEVVGHIHSRSHIESLLDALDKAVEEASDEVLTGHTHIVNTDHGLKVLSGPDPHPVPEKLKPAVTLPSFGLNTQFPLPASVSAPSTLSAPRLSAPPSLRPAPLPTQGMTLSSFDGIGTGAPQANYFSPAASVYSSHAGSLNGRENEGPYGFSLPSSQPPSTAHSVSGISLGAPSITSGRQNLTGPPSLSGHSMGPPSIGGHPEAMAPAQYFAAGPPAGIGSIGLVTQPKEQLLNCVICRVYGLRRDDYFSHVSSDEHAKQCLESGFVRDDASLKCTVCKNQPAFFSQEAIEVHLASEDHWRALNAARMRASTKH